MIACSAEDIVDELAHFPGVDGCALVESETGMVWFHSGSIAGVDRIAEAAIEFWRVQARLSSHFEKMGNLQSAVYWFSQRVVALFPCNEVPPLVLVCIAHKTDVSWKEWGVRAGGIRQALQQTGPPQRAGH